MSIDLRYSTSFKRALKRIAKKYRQVKLGVQPVINDIMSGKLPGEQIPHVGYPVYKVRIRNLDSQQGQRGGIV
ncbi:hypothetical protein [Agaribacter marinus]|uniref:Uncharacterized protein n=1 Tax=Agaribacter marinus TaxID=1431249 RepID=A0AA37T2J5_9ALTE|nr:hypothetical protein [Agaribacter marinus]GLR72779.1 hypothetical protein GCM10007852_36870 [Agaribacter marinus]